MWLFRPHRGGLKEAMELLQEFDTIDDIFNHISNDWNNWNEHVTVHPCDLMYDLYGENGDSRIGWSKTYVISYKAYNDIKYKEDYLKMTNGEKYNHPCIVFGFCTDDYEPNHKDIYNDFLKSLQ